MLHESISYTQTDQMWVCLPPPTHFPYLPDALFSCWLTSYCPWTLQRQTCVSSDNNVPIFRANSHTTHTPSEGKRKCSCSLLLEQLWQNILTRHLLIALLCKVVIGDCFSLFSPSFVTKKKNISAILSHYWLALCAGKWWLLCPQHNLFCCCSPSTKMCHFCNDCLLSQPF